jgi:hypothetical protein
MMNTIAFFLVNFLAISNGFTPSGMQTFTRPHKTSIHAAPQTPEELIETPDIWEPLKESLNTVPCYACTNDQGQPLQYNVGDLPLAFFYLDIDAAEVELKKAQEEAAKESAMSGMKLFLTPFPLGEVFEMGVKKIALVVPSQDGIEGAGAPAGMNPVGQQVPLFGCMDMVEDLPDGSAMVPMFLSKAEADDAMGMALEGLEDEEKAKFKVDVLPLAGAIQMQADSLGKINFTYVPPKSSLDYLRSLEE